MPPLDFATRAAMKRSGSVAGAVFWLACAGVLALILNGMVHDLFVDLLYIDHRTAELRRMHWAWMTCSVSLIALVAAMTVWIIARSLRVALGLPPRPERRFSGLFSFVRITAGLVLTVMLWDRTQQEYSFMYETHAPLYAFSLGLLLCSLFAYDVPRLLRNASAALRARTPMLGARFVELDHLPSSGRVHVRGRLAAPAAIASGGTLELEGKNGARVLVEVDPQRLVLIAEMTGSAEEALPTTLISEGTELRVVGNLRGGEDAYRSQVRVDAGDGKLHVYIGPATLTRRLLLAASVELLAAGGLLACVFGMVAFYAYLALRASMR